MILQEEEPWREDMRRQARADRGAIKCDCCGGEITLGEIKYSLDVGRTTLTMCESCKGELESSAKIHGFEEELEVW